MSLNKLFTAAALLLAPALAFAHPGHGDNGLIAGISHPLGGIDHLLAMVAVGLWAAQQKGVARWALPCTFVGTMLIGGVLGFEGMQLPAMESGIAASVLALGLAVALAVRPPLVVAVGGAEEEEGCELGGESTIVRRCARTAERLVTSLGVWSRRYPAVVERMMAILMRGRRARRRERCRA